MATRVRDAAELEELLALEPDDDMAAGQAQELEQIAAALDDLELRSLLRSPDDMRDAQVEISAGAGGTEAQDWAQMLMRMYTRWAERRGYATEILDLSEGEEAGIKGAVLEIRGAYAYGFLKAETGVHRLVRISPFDAQARRHTSFASVFVYPVVNEEINIEIRDEDISMDVFRASGAGGQHVNKTARRCGSRTFPRARHVVAAGALAAQEQGDRHEDAQEQALPARAGEAERRRRRRSTRPRRTCRSAARSAATSSSRTRWSTTTAPS